MSVLDPGRPVRLRPRPVAACWRPLVRSAAWGSVVVVVALWLSGRGAQLLAAGTAERLTSLGRLTGLVAADLLLVLVLLMARIHVIESSIGDYELARRHREMGFWWFTVLITQLVLITVGYA
ncbi:MAG: oxidoreductase, partial [Frankiales bacterium]|nr:oxidoreductase [Frankiales bacterium]